jgi:hypothetical protein
MEYKIVDPDIINVLEILLKNVGAKDRTPASFDNQFSQQQIDYALDILEHNELIKTFDQLVMIRTKAIEFYHEYCKNA